MTRSSLILAGAVAAVLAAGCASDSVQRPPSNPGTEPSSTTGMKATTSDPYTIRDTVRPPGYQDGNTMGRRGR